VIANTKSNTNAPQMLLPKEFGSDAAVPSDVRKAWGLPAI